MVEANFKDPDRGTLVHIMDGRNRNKITRLNDLVVDSIGWHFVFHTSFAFTALLVRMIKDFRIIVFYKQIVAYFQTLDYSCT